MKLYFEDGKLKIDVGEKETIEQYNLINDMWHIQKLCDGDSTTIAVIEFESQYLLAVDVAVKHGIEITQDVLDYYTYKKNCKEEEKRKKLHISSLEGDRNAALSKVETYKSRGCWLCPHLQYTKGHYEEINGRKRYVSARFWCEYADRSCLFSEEELEIERKNRGEYIKYAEYGIVGQVDGYYMATPYPCRGCRWMVEAHHILEEINKEKEKDV